MSVQLVHGPWKALVPQVFIPGDLRFMCVYGSHAHGLATESSDVDWRGVYQLPTDDFLGLGTPATTFERRALAMSDQRTGQTMTGEMVCWELGHFARLLLKGNPNIVGMMFAPADVVTTMEWPVQQLYGMRRQFVSQAMANAYMGWMLTERRSGEALTPNGLLTCFGCSGSSRVPWRPARSSSARSASVVRSSWPSSRDTCPSRTHCGCSTSSFDVCGASRNDARFRMRRSRRSGGWSSRLDTGGWDSHDPDHRMRSDGRLARQRLVWS